MFNRKEIIEYTREVLGDNAKGLFVDSSVIMGAAPDDYEIMTNLEKNIEANVSSTKRYSVCIGATKVVIVPHNSNYVIKIPFTGTYAVKRYGKDTNLIPFEKREYYFNGGVASDVCDEENANYYNASDELKKIMLYNEFFGWIDDVPIYIQKKIGKTFWDMDECENDYSAATRRIAKFINNKLAKSFYNYIASEFVCELIKTYGIAAAEEIAFEIAETIPDFHEGNYGFNRFGKCAIIDTAGYDCSNWEGSFDDQYV